MFAPTNKIKKKKNREKKITNALENEKCLSNIEKCAYVLNSECFSSLAVQLFFPSDIDDDAQETNDNIRVCVRVMCMCIYVCMKSSGNRGICRVFHIVLRCGNG